VPKPTPREALIAKFRLDGELHGHHPTDPIRFASILSDLDDLEEKRRQGSPLPDEILSPPVVPRGVWGFLRRRGSIGP
jgi:hypothetical protein